MPVLVLGTNNRKKRIELEQLLAPHGFELKTLGDFPNSIKVEETGETFRENAHLKAAEQAVNLGCWVLGEDSGLSVEALGGAPGVYSARYAGTDGDDEANNAKLLAELGDAPPEHRGAYYSCYAALADPKGAIRAEADGRCYGRIRKFAAGEAGFGYDPLFEVVEYHRTFGELGEAVKRALSHRARAMRLLIPQLLELVRRGEWR